MSNTGQLAKWPIALAAIREQGPCRPGWRKLLASLGYAAGDLDPERRVTLGDIASSNGPDDALWCARCLPIKARRDVVRAILPTVGRAAVRTNDDLVHASLAALRRWADGRGAGVGDLRRAEAQAFAAARAACAKGAPEARDAALAVWAMAEAASAWAADAVGAAAVDAARTARQVPAVQLDEARRRGVGAVGLTKELKAERARQVGDIVGVFGRLA